jgi:prepilin-type N-terminal cleavage/methylation domain-containing protein
MSRLPDPARAAAPRAARPDRPRRAPAARRGFTLAELAIVLSLAGILAGLAAPRFTAFRRQSALRSARLEVAAAVEAARGAALQKGRASRLVIAGDSLVVTVQIGAPGAMATGWLPVLTVPSLRREHGVRLQFRDPRDTLLAYDARGLAAPRLARTARVVLAHGAALDSVCVSNLGLLLPRGCRY